MHLIFKRHSGFTLLELSVVLLVLSLMMGGVFAALTQKARVEQQAELERRMDVIEQAVMAYYKRENNYGLPCPTVDQNVSFNNSAFGIGDDTHWCGKVTYNSSGTVIGNVPTKTLGIPDEYTLDPWGNRFVYAITPQFGYIGAGDSNRGLYLYHIHSSALSGFDKMTILDETKNPITDQAILVILSHGPDGFGAYTRDGQVKAAYSKNSHQMTNCHCDNDGIPTGATKEFVKRNYYTNTDDNEDNFDDTLRYYTRESFPLPNELTTEVQ
jgi:prepilin-type N-terminal cleavage/methylation domain-containing protein